MTVDLLSDDNTCKKLEHYSIHIIQETNNSFARKFLSKSYIDKYTCNKHICHNSPLCKIYGLVKIHKESFPSRPVVSSIGNPVYFCQGV